MANGGTMVWSPDQLTQWRVIQQAYLADTSTVLMHQALDQRRLLVQRAMTHMLHAFLHGSIALQEFNALFQQKTQHDWNAFNLRGMSGGMFLNKLVKYITDRETLTTQLRAGFRLPEDTRDGQRKMQALTRYLERLIAMNVVTRSQLQPSRVPFLLSAWWHLQDARRWPIFFPLVQHLLMPERGESAAWPTPIDEYFAFRTRFVSLTKELGVSLWELEHIAAWQSQKSLGEHMTKKMTRSSSLFINNGDAVLPETTHDVLLNDVEAPFTRKSEPECSEHTRIQWLLAKIGHQVGCDVWIAANDQSKAWNGERLGDLSLTYLPPFINAEFHRVINLIDVLWLRGNEVIAAYEIEHTTAMASGLLRLYDLDALCPSSSVHLCVVIPNPQMKRIQAVLARPAFRNLNMHERCVIIPEERLLEHAEHILRWASSPSVITRLALQVRDL
jgi:hypothetical protein